MTAIQIGHILRVKDEAFPQYSGSYYLEGDLALDLSRLLARSHTENDVRNWMDANPVEHIDVQAVKGDAS